MDEQWMEDFFEALKTEIAAFGEKWEVTPRVVLRDAASALTCVGNARRIADSKRSTKR